MRIFGIVSYKGTNYSGWQRQPNVISVQEVIEEKLSTFFNKPIIIYGAGRTDAGVHAYGQTFHFDVDVTDLDIDRLLYSLNKMLPEDINIIDLEEVEDDFHARFSAKSKTYSYSILKKGKDPFWHDMVYLYPKEFNEELFKEALNKFIGKHNFKNFTSKEEDQDNFVREIYSIECEFGEEGVIVVLKGNGFMRYMIRFIIGYSLDVASNKYPLESIDELLDEDSPREIVSSKAPSSGLTLLGVEY